MELGLIFLTILFALPLGILITFFTCVLMSTHNPSIIETRSHSAKRPAADTAMPESAEMPKHFHADTHEKSDKPGMMEPEIQKGEEYLPEKSKTSVPRSEAATIGFIPYQERIGAHEEKEMQMPSQYMATPEESPHVSHKIEAVPTSKGGRPLEIPTANYDVSPEFFMKLCRQKAENFAVEGKPSEMPIWICNREDKVVDVLRGLIQRNILSVPVLLPSTGKYYGFLDFMIIAKYIVEHFGKTQFAVERSFWDLIAEEKSFAKKTVSDLLSQKPVAPISYPVKAGYSAMCVFETLARERSLRRVPVVDNVHDQHLINLVTQSQCVRWLSSNISLLGEKRNKTVASCPNFIKPVHAVTESTIALEAFNEMVSKNISGLAIVEAATNRLKGNISLRDLKVIGSDASLFWRLHQTMRNFIIKLRHEYEHRHKRPVRIVYILREATIGHVIEVLARHDIHRVYIVDSHQHRKPIGLVSLRDILLECLG